MNLVTRKKAQLIASLWEFADQRHLIKSIVEGKSYISKPPKDRMELIRQIILMLKKENAVPSSSKDFDFSHPVFAEQVEVIERFKPLRHSKKTSNILRSVGVFTIGDFYRFFPLYLALRTHPSTNDKKLQQLFIAGPHILQK